MTKADQTERLVAEMEALPEYRGWQFTYEYPGYFCYSHPSNSFSVFCTPDWEGDETLPIQVQVGDGRSCEEYDARFPLPREGRTAQQIFDLVRPTLDKILTVLTYNHVDAWCEARDDESAEGWLTAVLDGTYSVEEMRAAVLAGRAPLPAATFEETTKALSAAVRALPEYRGWWVTRDADYQRQGEDRLVWRNDDRDEKIWFDLVQKSKEQIELVINVDDPNGDPYHPRGGYELLTEHTAAAVFAAFKPTLDEYSSDEDDRDEEGSSS